MEVNMRKQKEEFLLSPSGAELSPGQCINLNLFQEQAATTLESLLSLNQEIQKSVSATYSHLMNILDDILARKKNVEELLSAKPEAKSAIKPHKDANVFSYPYFRDDRDFCPPDNPDTIEKRQRNDFTAYIAPPRHWSKLECNRLKKGIYRDTMQKVVVSLEMKKNLLKKKLSKKEFSSKARIRNKLEKELAETKEEIKKLRKLKILDFYARYEGKIDWMKISAIVMEGLRSPEECENSWKNYIHPKVNRKKFSPQEDSKLSGIAFEHGCRDWDTISLELATNRTAIQCLERFQSQLNDNMRKRYWNKEEDDRLRNMIEKFRIGDYIPWNKVTFHMNGWTRNQVFSRWSRILNPRIRTGPWSTTEDSVLCLAYHRFGSDWTSCSQYINGRTNVTCRERYTNNLDRNLIAGLWTAEEDRLLFRLLARYGEGKWGLISRSFKGRTDSMVSQRCASLKKHNSITYKKILNGHVDTKFIEKNENFAPTKRCNTVNNQRKKLQFEAEKMIFDTVRELDAIHSFRVTPTCLEDFHNIPILEWNLVVQTLLLNDDYFEELEPAEPKYTFFTYRRQKGADGNWWDSTLVREREKRPLTSSDDDSDEFPFDEENTVDNELKRLLMPRILCGIKSDFKRTVAVSHSQLLESQELEKCFFKAFNVENSNEEYLDPELHGKDFSHSIPLLLDCFVWPKWEGDMIPIIPANMKTLLALHIFLNGCDERSAQTSVALQEDTDSFRHIISIVTKTDSKICSTCKNGEFQNLHERSTSAIQGRCKCSDVEAARKDFQLLKKRFFAIFFWPALMAATDLSSEQIEEFQKRLVRNWKYKHPNAKTKKHV